MKIILSIAVLGFSMSAHALLGGKSADADRDYPLVGHRKVIVQQPSSCYLIKQISGDGVSLKEYVDKANDTVFMIRSNSRVMMPLQPLMSESDFAEFRQVAGAPHSLSRNHRNRLAESTRLKVFVDNRQTAYRTFMILKQSVPSCAGNPEALP